MTSHQAHCVRLQTGADLQGLQGLQGLQAGIKSVQHAMLG